MSSLAFMLCFVTHLYIILFFPLRVQILILLSDCINSSSLFPVVLLHTFCTEEIRHLKCGISVAFPSLLSDAHAVVVDTVNVHISFSQLPSSSPPKKDRCDIYKNRHAVTTSSAWNVTRSAQSRPIHRCS